MAKKWINTASLEISENGVLSVAMSTNSSLPGGTKTVADAATPEKLVSDVSPCRLVWIGAPVDANGLPQNTLPVFIGDCADQNIPIISANYEGMVIGIDDASKLYIKTSADGEGVVFRIFA